MYTNTVVNQPDNRYFYNTCFTITIYYHTFTVYILTEDNSYNTLTIVRCVKVKAIKVIWKHLKTFYRNKIPKCNYRNKLHVKSTHRAILGNEK